MKKTKLIAPLLGATAIVSTVAPLMTLTSCGETSVNKVYLKEGCTATQNANATTKLVRYRFVQKNTKEAQDTKVYIADFKVNGVSHDIWDNTFTYTVDSAGNILVKIYTQNIINSVTNVKNISFNLVFKNKTANTKHKVGTFKVDFDNEEEQAEEATTGSAELTLEAVNGIPMKASAALYKLSVESTNDNVFVPITPEFTNNDDGSKMTQGTDYAYDRRYDGKVAYVYFPTYPAKGVNLESSTESENPCDFDLSSIIAHYDADGKKVIDGAQWFADVYSSTGTYLQLDKDDGNVIPKELLARTELAQGTTQNSGIASIACSIDSTYDCVVTPMNIKGEITALSDYNTLIKITVESEARKNISLGMHILSWTIELEDGKTYTGSLPIEATGSEVHEEELPVEKDEDGDDENDEQVEIAEVVPAEEQKKAA